MRPVNHPAQPAVNVYPDFRLDSLAHLITDLQIYAWATTSNVPWEFFDRTPTDGLWAIDALQESLLEMILHPPPPVPKKRKLADYVSLRDVAHYAALFRDRIYPLAHDPLCDAMGRFCSYCEQKLTETIAVEHVAPKANYPLTSLCWSNFLLCCRSCNSFKDEQPARTVAWLGAANDEFERYEEIRDHYLWPDTDAAAYTALKPALYASTGGAFQRVDDDVSVDDALVRTSRGNSTTKLPQAQVPFATGTVNANVRVGIRPSAPQLAAAQESHTMLGFPRTGVGSSDDNRMWDRTNVWLAAVGAFRALDATNDFPGQWASLCELAGSTGFLTTWVRVLELRGGAAAPYPAPPAMQTSQLLPQFLHEMTAVQDAPYPNTDLNCLP